jgi:hypothetical protein
MEYQEQGVCVSLSPNGLGVFSIRPFAAEELIGPIRGAVIDDPVYQSDYCMEVGEHSAMEPDSPFRFVNHSCQPNCGLLELEPASDDQITGVGELWLKALCDIPRGEQLTIDYAWPAWAAVPCRCGCPDCREWIVAADDLAQIVSESSLVSTGEWNSGQHSQK